MTKYCYLLKTGYIIVFDKEVSNYNVTMGEIWNNDMTRLVSSGSITFYQDSVILEWTYQKI